MQISTRTTLEKIYQSTGLVTRRIVLLRNSQSHRYVLHNIRLANTRLLIPIGVTSCGSSIRLVSPCVAVKNYHLSEDYTRIYAVTLRKPSAVINVSSLLQHIKLYPASLTSVSTQRKWTVAAQHHQFEKLAYRRFLTNLYYDNNWRHVTATKSAKLYRVNSITAITCSGRPARDGQWRPLRDVTTRTRSVREWVCNDRLLRSIIRGSIIVIIRGSADHGYRFEVHDGP
jgi:hypothetical protein